MRRELHAVTAYLAFGGQFGGHRDGNADAQRAAVALADAGIVYPATTRAELPSRGGSSSA